MRRGLLVAATVGSIALGSLVLLVALLGMRPAGGAGPVTALPTAPASPAGSDMVAPSQPIEPSVAPIARPSFPVPVGPRPTKRVVAALQSNLDELRETHGIPGVSAALIFDNGSTWTGVSGFADVAASRRVTPNTIFAIASISKTFTAALVLDLAAEGRLALEDGASEYLPGQKILEGVTIRMLLDHTSGLHDFFSHPSIDAALLSNPANGWTPTRTLGYVAKRYFPPGTGWHYSNTNYLILGLIAERVGERPLAEQLRERYFEPLRLDSAYYQDVERAPGPTAHGYRFAGSRKTLPAIDLADGTGLMPFKSVVTAAGGAGALAASAIDTARWARALYGGRAVDSGSLALMLGGFDRVAGYEPSIPYGLGVQALDVNGMPTLGHSGRFIGFRAVVRYLPDYDVTIAVLTNQSRTDPGIIVATLLRIAVPPPGPCGLCPDLS
ncbi:MAG: serine hydrolase [Chloroflexota bacterium]|nr:serine hydrolase [Chloroflexota bacterium]